ncbi:hypothetical protein JCM39194_02610 [Desulfotomaculum varum]
MAGERGSNYNAFTLFLIFILLYLSQKSVVGVNSESGVSNADEHYQPEHLADATEDNGVYEDEAASFQPSDSEINEGLELDQQEIAWPQPEEKAEEQAVAATLLDEVEQAPEISVATPAEETPATVGAIADQSVEDLPTLTEEVAEYDASDVAAEEPAIADTQDTEEPVLGGQQHLFLEPTVMTGFHTKKQPASPKINIKFGC